MRRYARMGRRVWLHEWKNFLFHDRRVADGPTLRQFCGAPQDHEEVPVRVVGVREKRGGLAKNWLSRVKQELSSSL